jgi:hypothetical protein
VACQFAGAGCDFRGPSKKMTAHQVECRFKKEGRKKYNNMLLTKYDLRECEFLMP